MKRFATALCVLTWIVLACEMPAMAGSGQAQPVSDAPPAADVLFHDDFSGSGSGEWHSDNNPDHRLTLQDGVFQFLIEMPDVLVWSPAGMNFEDICIDVDAEKIDGPDDAEFGVICRYTRDESGSFSYYYFLITGDRHAKIGKVIQSEASPISGDFRFEEIQEGDAMNRIGAECIGNQLTLYVNNSEILVVADDTLSEGDVGLVASTSDAGEMQVQFDNFVVSQR